MQLHYIRHDLQFIRPGGTSRGVLHTKETWLLRLEHQGRVGYGECGLLRGLSADDRPDYEQQLRWLQCEGLQQPEAVFDALQAFPSIQMGWESAWQSLQASDPFILFDTPFSRGDVGIPINGLIWMGSASDMQSQIQSKLDAGFGCLKLKIGALDWPTEWGLLQQLRQQFSAEQLEIRVDANGAFTPEQAPAILDALAALQVHSIEQPIRAGQWEAMAQLCAQTPIPIALDEELIGVFDAVEQQQMLDAIRPQYIIVKPSFVGGFTGTTQWIAQAEQRGIGWWLTSALESAVGLNAIAQYASTLPLAMPQGLGTGALYSNNFEAPLEVSEAALWYRPAQTWEAPLSNFFIP